MIIKHSSLLFIIFLLAGCDQLEQFNSNDKLLTLKISPKNNINEVADTLKERFHEYPASIFSKIEANINSDIIEFKFIKGAPNKKLVEYLVLHQGKFTAQSKTGIIWFTSNDIVNASTTRIDGINYLDLRVTDKSGNKVYNLTKNKTKKIVSIYFDGELLTTVVVRVPIRKSIRITVNKEAKELSRIAAILRSGQLTGKIQIIKNEI